MIKKRTDVSIFLPFFFLDFYADETIWVTPSLFDCFSVGRSVLMANKSSRTIQRESLSSKLFFFSSGNRRRTIGHFSSTPGRHAAVVFILFDLIKKKRSTFQSSSHKKTQYNPTEPENTQWHLRKPNYMRRNPAKLGKTQ